MKILIPRSSSSKGCDPFSCDIYNCAELFIGRKKKKRPSQKTSPNCGQYWCGQVTFPGKKT